jgi:hypothetical protein
MVSEAYTHCERPSRGVAVVQAARPSRPWVGHVLHVDELLRVASVQLCESYRWQQWRRKVVRTAACDAAFTRAEQTHQKVENVT